MPIDVVLLGGGGEQLVYIILFKFHRDESL